MKQIHVTYGDSPQQMIRELLARLNPVQHLPAGARIGLKPNLVCPKTADSGATTTPELVGGIIAYLQERGFRHIEIMESCWTFNRTPEVFKACGYEELAGRYQVPLVDLQQDRTVKMDVEGLVIEVCRRPLDVDYLINIPVLKAHRMTRVTCALKNLKGCIPDREKQRFHSLGLHKPIACLNRALKSDLVIVDGLNGDLTGEEGGNPIPMNRIIVATDPVLVDAYVAELMGYETCEIDYIGLAEKMGVGSSAPRQIYEYNTDQMPLISMRPSRINSYLAGWVNEKEACSPCYSNLMQALTRLQEKGDLQRLRQKVAVGQGWQKTSGEGLGVGRCCRGLSINARGCPPPTREILAVLRQSLD